MQGMFCEDRHPVESHCPSETRLKTGVSLLLVLPGLQKLCGTERICLLSVCDDCLYLGKVKWSMQQHNQMVAPTLNLSEDYPERWIDEAAFHLCKTFFLSL